MARKSHSRGLVLKGSKTSRRLSVEQKPSKGGSKKGRKAITKGPRY